MNTLGMLMGAAIILGGIYVGYMYKKQTQHMPDENYVGYIGVVDVPKNCVIPAGANGYGDSRFGKYTEQRTVYTKDGKPIVIVCTKE
jgi:hypothetical protein